MAKSKNCQNCGARAGAPHHQPLSTLNGTEPTAADTRLVVVRTFRPDQKHLCQLCTEGRREMISAQKKALAKAQRTQVAFWRALRELEVELGGLVNGSHSLSGMTVEDLLGVEDDGA